MFVWMIDQCGCFSLEKRKKLTYIPCFQELLWSLFILLNVKTRRFNVAMQQPHMHVLVRSALKFLFTHTQTYMYPRQGVEKPQKPPQVPHYNSGIMTGSAEMS